MKVLIFGVTGNSGRYCARTFLKNGWRVYGVGRSSCSLEHNNLSFIQGDILDDELYKRLPTDVELVINFAGVQPSILPTSENTNLSRTLESYVDINIKGVFKILEFVRKAGISTYIYTTSHRDLEMHWSNDRFLTNDMTQAINYQGDHTMYAITKTSAKMMGDYYGKAFGIRVFNLRLPMIFLVPEKPFYLKDGKQTLMPFLQVIKNAMQGENLEIWGEPSLVRDYVHIDNLISLIELTYKSSLDGGTFNVGTGEAVTTEEFIKTIGSVFAPDPDKIQYIYKPEKNTYKCAIYDVSEQKSLLGYNPVLLEDMLIRLKTEIIEGDYISKWGWGKDE